MLIDVTKDEISLILYLLDEYDLDGNGNVGLTLTTFALGFLASAVSFAS